MERFKKVADIIEDNSLVVDAGCGTGELIKYLFHLKKGCVFSGIDFSEVSINDARKERPNCRFIADDVLNLSKYYSEVDYVVSFETIEHT